MKKVYLTKKKNGCLGVEEKIWKYEEMTDGSTELFPVLMSE